MGKEVVKEHYGVRMDRTVMEVARSYWPRRGEMARHLRVAWRQYVARRMEEGEGNGQQ